ncbi:hypothetical protein G7Z17_g5562 [Cylindrodendrum hubeiense]|uniref:Uncharacterized protein n=1 Tax=Cylindrodendrum hubeiense TaxID=595255 RepID=A0A9P5LBM6_9HYPO|nr:hypothetical protein G7Z17_g5562 [Cylindrodendrum hubeiense]
MASSSTSSTGNPLSIPDTEPVRHQVFRVESPKNHHKLLIQTSSNPLLSLIAHITRTADSSQSAMTFVEEVVDTPDPLAAALNTKYLGSVTAQDFDRLRTAYRRHPLPKKASPEQDSPDEYLGRGRVWLRELVDMLISDGILQPPPDCTAIIHTEDVAASNSSPTLC